jgi:drug/metabolite transporter (DMT)-like permease
MATPAPDIVAHVIRDDVARAKTGQGVLLGALGVLGFSFTLPATKAAVVDLNGTFVGLARAVVAALLAVLVLSGARSSFPARRHWPRLARVALGIVIGFPLFTALALHSVTAAHGAVITGLLPAATAVLAVVLAGERPLVLFWIVSFAGLTSVVAFAMTQGAGSIQTGDVLALIAVALGALGYAEGAILTRQIGAWRVICWALLFAAPITVPASLITALHYGLAARPSAWAGFAYISIVSMFLAFFPWYRGLALGGVARVSQVQLVQPVLTLLWSAMLLGEHVSRATIAAAGAVVICAAASQRTRIRSRPPPETA